MGQTIEVGFKFVAQVVQAAFPGAKSRRTVKIDSRNSYNVQDYWDEGSRYECRFVELGTFNMLTSEHIPHEARQKMSNPFNLPICEVKLTPGYCIVEHVIFRGKSLGYRIYVAKERFNLIEETNILQQFTSPSTIVPMLPEATYLDDEGCPDTIPYPVSIGV